MLVVEDWNEEAERTDCIDRLHIPFHADPAQATALEMSPPVVLFQGFWTGPTAQL